MTKKYLVTGGAGFIGAAFVRRLLSEGADVRVLGRSTPSSLSRLNDLTDDFEFIYADIRDFEQVSLALQGVDSVVHMAAITATQSFYDHPTDVLDVGVKGMLNIIDACKKWDVGELIFVSSSEAYQTPITVPTDEKEPLKIPDLMNPRYSYGGSKAISEMLAIHHGRHHFDRVLVCRPHNVYGPDMGWSHVLPHFITRMQILSNVSKQLNDGNIIQFPVMGSGLETRAFEYIDDFVDGMMIMMAHGEHCGIYHIGNDEETTIANAACAVGRYFGHDIDIIPSEGPEGGTNRRCPDISKLVALGYTPKVNFRDGLPLMATWYKENAHKAPNKSGAI
jgi:nucleoside-diphosphate-sugar epimerase